MLQTILNGKYYEFLKVMYLRVYKSLERIYLILISDSQTFYFIRKYLIVYVLKKFTQNPFL